MISTTQIGLLTKERQEYTNKPLTNNILSLSKQYGISIRNLNKIYNETYPKSEIAFSTFYYKLNSYTFSETEYNRIGIILKAHKAEIEKFKKSQKL